MVELKTASEVERIRQAGKVVAGLLNQLESMVSVGLKTKALDEEARRYVSERKAQPAFLGYKGFPAAICVSINEEIVHGIPGSRKIEEGDLVSLDVGVLLDGFYADAAISVIAGKGSQTARRLLDTTRIALERAIAQATVGNRLSDISHVVQETVEKEGFGVIRDFVGHGIGKALHEDPPIPNFGAPHSGIRLQEGMVLAIEPMVSAGSYSVEILSDGWTAITKDRSLAAHFEHTVALTERGPEVLTV